MRRRTGLAAAGVAVTLALAGLAGCGGSDATVTETVTTGAASVASVTSPPATATAPATAPTTTATAPATAPAARLGEADLPPEDAVSGVAPGAVTELATAKAFVDTLYAQGDPNKAAAQTRFEDAGYAGAVLRDQTGANTATGLTKLRTYAFTLRDADAARAEVAADIDEVRRTEPATITDIDIADVPGCARPPCGRSTPTAPVGRSSSSRSRRGRRLWAAGREHGHRGGAPGRDRRGGARPLRKGHGRPLAIWR